MAVVRGFLSPREQQEIVNSTAALGVGEGGFYIPSYGNRGAQKLFMMNLGWHWNLQTRLYEDRRHDFDDARPPVSKTDGFCIKNKELYIKNKEICI